MKELNGTIYFDTKEVCQKANISRATLFRWIKRGLLNKMHKDRRGWRLFTEEDLATIQEQAGKIEIVIINLPDSNLTDTLKIGV